MKPQDLDALDSLNLLGLVEDEKRSEQVLTGLIENGTETDRELLHSLFLGSDRNAEFERYLGSNDFAASLRLLRTFRVENSAAIIEVGGGAGFLSWALTRSGLTSVDLFEPNSQWFSGTGYLRSRPDCAAVTIFNDMNQWHALPKKYDVLITKNCIHHFRNIAYAAAILRQKLKPSAKWFAFREWFADSAHELAHQLHSHPGCQKYSMYEWPYPAHHYVEAIELAGFRLLGVVPHGYGNNCLTEFSERPDPRIRDTETFDHQLAAAPKKTVDAFWQEVAANRARRPPSRVYTRPQALVFERVEIDLTMTALDLADAADIRLTLPDAAPGVRRPSDEWTMTVVVTNGSSVPVSGYPPAPINLSYHWYADRNGQPALDAPVVYEGMRSPLLPILAPGESEPYAMTLKAPPKPGRYWLRITCVQEGVRWFEALGWGSHIDFPIDVRPQGTS